MGENNLSILLPVVVSKKECKIGNCISKKKLKIILNGKSKYPKETVNPLYKTQSILKPAKKNVEWQIAPYIIAINFIFRFNLLVYFMKKIGWEIIKRLYKKKGYLSSPGIGRKYYTKV